MQGPCSAERKPSFSNFFKYVRKRYQSLLQITVTLREFNPGEYSEVDHLDPLVELKIDETASGGLSIGHWIAGSAATMILAPIGTGLYDNTSFF